MDVLEESHDSCEGGASSNDDTGRISSPFENVRVYDTLLAPRSFHRGANNVTNLPACSSDCQPGLCDLEFSLEAHRNQKHRAMT
ncbi:hypothetical protein DID88_001753 [Monilinia fructigena]|uniref:Uncharacterized protein n=1 Tax=Monilinia fructigena TaxID=38457 RepID=A0A395IWT4_9HELO|nr:hypothetical protein DID88_001753 [Monilinia fructigena]